MLENIGSIAISLASFVTVLSIVVFVHEFGHYQVARWFKVKVESFSIGFGPELLAWTAPKPRPTKAVVCSMRSLWGFAPL
jgi:regulator of sigma E protease